MSRFRFTGQGPARKIDNRDGWNGLERVSLGAMDAPEDYAIHDDGLVSAVNTALTLGMPLLVTGAPGVGKTQLGFRIAYELGCEPIFFPVKSSSEAHELFYHIDHMRRLHTAQVRSQNGGGGNHNDPDDPAHVRHFLRFQGLGLAILRAMPPERLEQLGLEDKVWPDHPERKPRPPRQPSVVVVDEIDKAPADFCNDMLEEIRKLQFSVPELSNRPFSIYGNPENPQPYEENFRPQLVVTSNSETSLPEPFLRRCVYYHIEGPDDKALQNIIEQRLEKQGLLEGLNPALQKRSRGFFLYLRDTAQTEKSPSTGELLSWFLLMAERADELREDKDNEVWLQLACECLLKYRDDSERLKSLYTAWQQSLKG